MRKQSKKLIESKPFTIDPEMKNILQGSVDVWKSAVLRAKEMVRVDELKLKKAQDRLDKYMKGELHKE